MGLTLEILSNHLGVCKLAPSKSPPSWVNQSTFFSISKTDEELSIVCESGDIPKGVQAERGWRCLKVKGPLDFGLTGILSSLATPLAAARISIFAISTFDTDYILVKEMDLERATDALRSAGHSIL